MCKNIHPGRREGGKESVEACTVCTPLNRMF